MGLPTTFQAQSQEPVPHGVALALYPSDATFAFEIQRAPDSGGSPDEGAAITFYAPPGAQLWVDETGAVSSTMHYRIRHARQGYTAGPWTPWYAVKPDRLPATLPIVPPEPLMDFDLYVDTDGAVFLYVNGSPRVQSVKWAVAMNGVFPSIAGGDVENTNDDGNADVVTGATATPGNVVAATVGFYDGPDGTGVLLGTVRRSVAFGGSLSCYPMLDEDAGTLHLFPNRGGAAGAVRYLVTDDGTTPDKATVLATGFLTTDQKVPVYLFTVDDTTVDVFVVPTEGSDGSGATGDLVRAAWTYEAGNNRPVVSWVPWTPPTTTASPDPREGIKITARDDAYQVRIFWRKWADGDAVPGWTDTGLQDDPYTLPVDVPRPAEGSKWYIEFYAEDENGTRSHEVPLRVEVDGNFYPSGSLSVFVERTTGEVRAVVNTNDSDSGSFRLSWVKRTVGAGDENTFTVPGDGVGTEYAATSFGVPYVIPGVRLKREEVLNVSAVIYRTTSTTWVDQQGSPPSPLMTAQARQGVETENRLKGVWLESGERAVPTTNLRYFTVRFHWQADPDFVKSIVLSWSGPASGSATINTSGVHAGTYSIAGAATIVDGSHAPTGEYAFTATPYDAVDGGGTAGVPVSGTHVAERELAPASNSGIARSGTELALDVSSLPVLGDAVDAANDFLAVYDGSGAATKKVNAGAVMTGGAVGATGPTGPAWITAFYGTWSSLSTYIVGDTVRYNGSMYRAKLGNTNKPPETNPSYWDMLVQTGGVGATGAQGPIGPAGPAGAVGAQGATGPAGATGPQGDPGPNGAPGVQGATGPRGLTHRGNWSSGAVSYAVDDSVFYIATGSSYRCVTAHTSDVGKDPTNPIYWTVYAMRGDEGLQGPQGATGAQGPAGNQGATGPQGDPGLNGTTGATGATGAQGPQGMVGNEGPPGATGAQGATGATGVKGVTLRGNWSYPVAYAVGDVVYDWTVGFSWACILAHTSGETSPPALYEGTRWVRFTSQGGTGSTGATGPQGPEGNPGTMGATGPQGPQGPAGPSGLQGMPGTDGPVGATGPAGATGPQGPAGAAGPQGATGVQGPAGPAGATGPDGNPGANGPVGATGATGPAPSFAGTPSEGFVLTIFGGTPTWRALPS